MNNEILKLLEGSAQSLLEHRCQTVPKEQLHLPGPDFVDRVFIPTDRPPQVLRSLQSIFDHGRLAGTGYLSILPVDQGIEHSAGASFAPNPAYFDPETIVQLALEGGCNAVASTLGVLGAVSRKYAHRIPFLVKLNHNELITYPNEFDQIYFGQVEQAWNMGAAAVGATRGEPIQAPGGSGRAERRRPLPGARPRRSAADIIHVPHHARTFTD